MMPPSPRGSVQEQLVRQYSYLFQMAQQLNVALGQLESGGTAAPSGGTAAPAAEQNDFRATFTASKLSFWQDASEVAYVSNNRLYITNITVLEGMSIGEWEISSENGLVIRWMGG